MQCLRRRAVFTSRRSPLSCVSARRISSASAPFNQVPLLPSWDLAAFRSNAFTPARPHRLPLQSQQLLLASSKWFIHDSNASFDLAKSLPKASELRTAFWADYEDTVVPLELTSKASQALNQPSSSTFHRSEAPLKLLLAYLGNAQSPSASSLQQHSIYLAQCSLDSLPKVLQADVPIPSLVLNAGKGDVYESSLWLGRPPTYTPLHRDPNPNFFLQLAGRKVIRLFPPEVGDAIFDQVQEQLRQKSLSAGGGRNSPLFRGEEMMAGPERELLHRTVWEAENVDEESRLGEFGQEAEMGLGEALFIPKGWWHSVKGIGHGITASANWWFR